MSSIPPDGSFSPQGSDLIYNNLIEFYYGLYNYYTVCQYTKARHAGGQLKYPI